MVHLDSTGVPREDVYLIVYVNRTIYITYIINGRFEAYINGPIGLFLVSQPSLSTTHLINYYMILRSLWLYTFVLSFESSQFYKYYYYW